MALLRRDRFVPVVSLNPGTALPPRRTWDQSQPGQVLEHVATDGTFWRVTVHDLATDEHYEARVTERGLPCPERRNLDVAKLMPGWSGPGSEVDWARAERAPHAQELQEGDLLPKRDHRSPDYEVQTVSSVGLTYYGLIQLRLHTAHGVIAPTYELDELVEFPQDMARFRDRRRGQSPLSRMDAFDRDQAKAQALHGLETLQWVEDTRTGLVLRLVRHPYGRGIWPRELPAYDEQRTSPDGGPVISQPPRPQLAMLHAPFMRRLSPQEVVDLVNQWGEPQPMWDAPAGCNREGVLANGHPQPRSQAAVAT